MQCKNILAIKCDLQTKKYTYDVHVQTNTKKKRIECRLESLKVRLGHGSLGLVVKM